MQKLYLAASFSRKDTMDFERQHFLSYGFEVVSSWMDEDVPATKFAHQIDADYLEEMAQVDIIEMDLADAMVFYSQGAGSANVGGGRFFEMGYMYAQGKPIIVVGEREMIFQYIPTIYVVDTTYQAISALLGKAMQDEWKRMRALERLEVERRESVQNLDSMYKIYLQRTYMTDLRGTT